VRETKAQIRIETVKFWKDGRLEVKTRWDLEKEGSIERECQEKDSPPLRRGADRRPLRGTFEESRTPWWRISFHLSPQSYGYRPARPEESPKDTDVFDAVLIYIKLRPISRSLFVLMVLRFSL
jgi:hypothetical protein